MADVLDDDKPAKASEPKRVSALAPKTSPGPASGRVKTATSETPATATTLEDGARSAAGAGAGAGAKAKAKPWERTPPARRPRRLRRTWPQRLLLGLNGVLVLACLATATGLWYGYNNIAEKFNRVVITREPDTQAPIQYDANGNVVAFGEQAAGDLSAENFLVVGTDSRACRPDNPQYAGAFGGEGGENTDTMMLVRLDPVAKQASILSFPRDLWIKRPDNGQNSRINDLFDPLSPNVLIEGIRQNFGLPVHHYIGVDFCGFRDLVNSVGGVKIPFEYPARDTNTGLSVDTPGCVEFDGDAALAYARSRHYQWQDEDGDWHDDETNDYGRVARQQDFVRRVLRKAVDKGATNPTGLQSLIRVATKHITIDQDLTAQDLYDWGRALRDVPPEQVGSFTIVGRDAMVGDADVQKFDVNEPANAMILAVFSGQAALAASAAAETAPPAAGPGDAVAVPAAQPDDTPPPTEPGAGGEVAPAATNERNAESIVPPVDPNCT
jgi:LCP family protein required for cell wall assembly